MEGLHKLQLKHEPGDLEIKLDDFRVKGIIDYKIEKSSASGIAELTLKLAIKNPEIEI